MRLIDSLNKLVEEIGYTQFKTMVKSVIPSTDVYRILYKMRIDKDCLCDETKTYDYIHDIDTVDIDKIEGCDLILPYAIYVLASHKGSYGNMIFVDGVCYDNNDYNDSGMYVSIPSMDKNGAGPMITPSTFYEEVYDYIGKSYEIERVTELKNILGLSTINTNYPGIHGYYYEVLYTTFVDLVKYQNELGIKVYPLENPVKEVDNRFIKCLITWD